MVTMYIEIAQTSRSCEEGIASRQPVKKANNSLLRTPLESKHDSHNYKEVWSEIAAASRFGGCVKQKQKCSRSMRSKGLNTACFFTLRMSCASHCMAFHVRCHKLLCAGRPAFAVLHPVHIRDAVSKILDPTLVVQSDSSLHTAIAVMVPHLAPDAMVTKEEAVWISRPFNHHQPRIVRPPK